MGVEKMVAVARDATRGGGTVVLATVVSVSGSTPAGPGFQMVVGRGGRIAGTVGGGIVEHVAERSAVQLIDRAGSPAHAVDELRCGCERPGRHEPEAVRRFSLTPEKAGSVGMVCGGDMDVLFTPLDEPGAEALAREVKAALGATDAWLALPLDGGAPMVVRGLACDGPCDETEAGGAPVLAMRLGTLGVVYVFGGGHVAQALIPVLAGVDFPVVVIDDRPEFADPELFPDAADVRCLSLKELAGNLTVGTGDRICVMTRGHAGDTDVLRFALSTPARYVGAMGSSSKRESVFSKLESEGYEQVRERVIMPIGLPLGGRTPAEIAISITAQLIEDRARG